MDIDIPEKIQKIIDQYPDMNEAPLYSAKGLSIYIELIKLNHTSVDIQELLSHGNMKMEEIKDPGHWFNQNQINAFMDSLIRQTGNPEIGREAGRFVCAPESLGMLRSYYRAFGSPLAAFQKLTQLAEDISLSANYQSIVHARNKIEVIVTPYPGVKEEKFQCDNRKGYFEGVFQLFHLPLPKIDHDQCLFDKHDKCRYFVSWELTKSEKYKKIHNMLFLISVVIMIIMPSILFTSTLFHCFFVFLFIHIGIRLHISYLGNKELRSIIENQADIQSTAYTELSEQIQKTYQSFDMFRKISMGLSKPHQLKNSLQTVINVLQDRYDRCAILLANENKTKLIYEVGFGYTEAQLQLWEKTGWFHVLEESQGTFIRSFRENRSFLINYIEDVIDDFSLRSIEFVKKMQVKSLISCPIYYDGQPLGVLGVDNYKKQRELIQSDINLLAGIAHQIGIHIQYHLIAKEDKKSAMDDMALQVIHNIRSPASAIDVNLKYIQRKCQLDSKVAKKFQAIQRQNSRIFELLQDFLRFTRPIETRLEKCHINRLLNDIVNQLHIEEDIHLKLSSYNSIVRASKADFKWIFEELLANTKKYGAFPVVIHTKVEDPMIQIFYKDSGNGVLENIKDDIFEPFFSSDKQGSGLGLSIIRKIIEAHGGKISLRNNANSGTCFIVLLPLYKE